MSFISYCELNSGEYVALEALEVISIPHLSILNSQNLSEMVEKYRMDFSGLLSEVYQAYRSSSCPDFSIEILWATEAVTNQPYNAKIRLFFVSRVIGLDRNSAGESVDILSGYIRSLLSGQKYEYADISFEDYADVLKNIRADRIHAVVKEEKIDNLQNNILPYCASYDLFPSADNDLSKLVSVLTEQPNAAVSFQLMPTYLLDEEAAFIDKITQMLEVLGRGINDNSVGNISFSTAEKLAKKYRFYSEHKVSPLFMFNVLVFGDELAAANITSRVYGQLSEGRESKANLQILKLNQDQADKDGNVYPLPWAVNSVLQDMNRNSGIYGNPLFSAFYRLPYIITEEEACEFFRLPIGSNAISAGLNINESGKNIKNYYGNVINAGDISVGKLRSSQKDEVGFQLKDLAKHMLIVGTPGSGKTTFSVSVLDRLWKDHSIPFLVIEPAKNEYRSLVQSIPDLQVFTPGKNFVSPFVFNPFIPPKNVRLETYKSTLKTAFAAAVTMSSPLDKIFEETINNCYSDFRWLDSYTSDNKGRIFNIADFIKCFEETFQTIGYTGDAKNIGRAGLVRLNSLANLFDNYFSIPIEDMLKKPTVIELAAIENGDEKALIIALLLLSVLAYVNSNYVGEGGLRNVILLEEAHVLLSSNSGANSYSDANPSAIAQELVKRMLAEIRSYGVGLIIADQSPKKVSRDVIGLTDMKVCFRLVETEDKQIIADSTNMSDTQMKRVSKLRPGEAFFFFNKLDEPEEVITPDYRLENNISISLSDEGIKELSGYWKDKQDKLRPYPQCMFCSCCQDSCDYSRRMLARDVSRRIFVRNFSAADTKFDKVKSVLGKITSLIKAELNDEEFTHELFLCVKVHLWRKIKYGTKIPVKDIQIENSLKK